jgi:hypothetical protein
MIVLLGAPKGVAAAAVAGSLFVLGIDTDDFVQPGAQIAAAPQDASQPLLGLPAGRRAADHDGDFHFGQIDAFVQDLVGDQRRVAAVRQALQDVEAFVLAAVIQQAGDQEPPRHLARHGVRTGEHQTRLAHVQAEQVLQDAQLFLRAVLDRLTCPVGFHRGTSCGSRPGLGAHVLPVEGRILAPPLVHVAADLVGVLVVTSLLVGQQVHRDAHTS